MNVRVAVFAPLTRTFDYRVPPELARTGELALGSRVWVPLGGRSVEGVIVSLEHEPSDAMILKPIQERVDAPPLPADLLALARWMADYYQAPLGEALRLMVPAGGRARTHKRVALTDEGRRQASAHQSVLLPPWALPLDGVERALLAKLTAHDVARSELDTALLKKLTARGLVALVDEARVAASPTDRWLTIARALEPVELGRAARRRQIYQAIAEAGELRAADLRQRDAQSGALVAQLVKDGLVSVQERPRRSDPFARFTPDRRPPPQLNAAQAHAVATVEPLIAEKKFAAFVLHGVTGSGKTEVYLQAIAHALALGRQALVLVPEIALTPQLAARFGGRFEGRVVVLHSGLADAERRMASDAIARGEANIVVGARSAVFAPLARLGVIVVDEEHDSSFKQEEGVRYHARDVALMRARAHGAVVLLGSATPSLEMFLAAQDGRLGLLELPFRATTQPLPSVELLDLRQHRPGAQLLTAPLVTALGETLARGEQALLFLNRRGFSTFVLCTSCGKSMGCPDCAVSLTYHQSQTQPGGSQRARLTCHYCGHQTPLPHKCPLCGAAKIERLGYGTEQVEERLRELFPTARVGRLDRDTAEGDGLFRILEALQKGALDIVVGTQMITKGHDFPSVTLVGVVLADQGIGLPDFRASERTFQLLAQVAGRAGRGGRAGRVLIQTYRPDHLAIDCARTHDYARFAAAELEHRRELGYPPLSRMACVRYDGVHPGEVQDVARRGGSAAAAAAKGLGSDENAVILGPSEAPLSRLKGRTRWQLFVRAKTPRAVRWLARAAADIERPSTVRATVDIDPMSML